MKKTVIAHLLFVFNVISSSYLPTSDEVVAGSVLLPTTRRGRFLASLIRRQAVDGTGVQFNADADAMNAKAKQKYNVLSDDLLPYIIAEQERRITLYKRVMTAIQNGEKGVTVVEFRNKTPLFIKKGSLFRCPKNKPPQEPDGSGVLRCEDNVEPTGIIYDSCLNAEDKLLYNSGPNRYFFCNRYKEEGPSVMESENKAILCAPNQRTSLNYTRERCAIEGSYDVIMHYRYYPDHKYEKVHQMDPDREVCDHWRPCSIGYIFALPTPDQAVPATELWDDFVENIREYEADESIAAIPEDISTKSGDEYVSENIENYQTSLRKFLVPPGYEIFTVKYRKPGSVEATVVPNEMLNFYRSEDQSGRKKRSAETSNENEVAAELAPELADELAPEPLTKNSNGTYYYIQLHFKPFTSDFYGDYRVFMKDKAKRKHENLFSLKPAKVRTSVLSKSIAPGEVLNDLQNQFECLGKSCKLTAVEKVVPGVLVQELEDSQFSALSNDGVESVTLKIGKSDEMSAADYYGKFNVDGELQRIKLAVISVMAEASNKVVELDKVLSASGEADSEFNDEVKFTCADCTLLDVLRNGESVIDHGFVNVDRAEKTIKFGTTAFSASYGGQYVATFEAQGIKYMKNIGVIESKVEGVELAEQTLRSAPIIRVNFGKKIHISLKINCNNCTVNEVTVNGMSLKLAAKQTTVISILPAPSTVNYWVHDSQTVVCQIVGMALPGFGGPVVAAISNNRGNVGYYKLFDIVVVLYLEFYPSELMGSKADPTTENGEELGSMENHADDDNSTLSDSDVEDDNSTLSDSDGNSTDGDGNSTDGDGNSTDGDGVDGNSTDGDGVDVNSTDGDGVDGNSTDDEVNSTDGDVGSTDGDGVSPDGDGVSPDGDGVSPDEVTPVPEETAPATEINVNI